MHDHVCPTRRNEVRPGNSTKGTYLVTTAIGMDHVFPEVGVEEPLRAVGAPGTGTAIALEGVADHPGVVLQIALHQLPIEVPVVIDVSLAIVGVIRQVVPQYLTALGATDIGSDPVANLGILV